MSLPSQPLSKRACHLGVSTLALGMDSKTSGAPEEKTLGYRDQRSAYRKQRTDTK